MSAASAAWERDWVRLPLEGAHNVRELGGYPAADGRPLCFHRFLRADSLSYLTADDAAFLQGYGLRTIIDLRGIGEAERDPDVRIDGVSYHHIPLFDVNIADSAQNTELNALDAEGVYELVLTNLKAVGDCLRTIAAADEGCILFHCSAGKDRTGILAYILMALAGCDRWDCVAAYIPSRVNIMRTEWFPYMWETHKDADDWAHFDSHYSTIEHAIDWISANFGSVEDYVLACGVSKDEIAAIRARLLEP